MRGRSKSSTVWTPIFFHSAVPQKLAAHLSQCRAEGRLTLPKLSHFGIDVQIWLPMYQEWQDMQAVTAPVLSSLLCVQQYKIIWLHKYAMVTPLSSFYLPCMVKTQFTAKEKTSVGFTGLGWREKKTSKLLDTHFPNFIFFPNVFDSLIKHITFGCKTCVVCVFRPL